MYKKLIIDYANPLDLNDSISLEFLLRNNPIVPRWIELVKAAQEKYPIDDPTRFYGFGDNQIELALLKINKCIELINSHKKIINRSLDSVNNQEVLNYLHNIFERYHGLLDKQNSKFWLQAPNSVRRALADLNILVHRCESVAKGNEPRHVVTWFGLPKDQLLKDSDYLHAVHIWQPGTVFLNYVEIGKTLQDLADDNDQYIAPEAFKPFRHYSSDFVVRFFEQTPVQAHKKDAIMLEYYKQHQTHFGAWQDCYTNGSLPLADIVGSVNLGAVRNRQQVEFVKLI